MPAQPLMHSAALVDDRVAVVDKQLQLGRAPRRGAVGSGLVRGSRRAPQPARRSDQTCRVSGHDVAPAPSASAALVPVARRRPAVAVRASGSSVGSPRAPTAAPHRVPLPTPEARRCRSRRCAQQRVGRPRQRRPRSPTACARPLRSRSSTSPPNAVGGDRRADRPQSRRKPRSYQVTLDGLGRRRRHNAGRSAPGRHPECGSAAAGRVCDSNRTPSPRRG